MGIYECFFLFFLSISFFFFLALGECVVGFLLERVEWGAGWRVMGGLRCFCISICRGPFGFVLGAKESGVQ